ncbi:D-tyrosyl-tRNA(Tyr) deacylase [bacterium]|jgi:D-aminoacyl-tRNA deacylase|nr:D-tyrosyl-tRNA(Tyr) deacylase [bacterium]
MRAVVQRVSKASVEVDNKVVSKISNGLLVLIGLTHEDSKEEFNYTINKILKLRIFDDEQGVMNKSVVDISGEILLVSQFTLYGDCRKGNRPSYQQAMNPDKAKKEFDNFFSCFKRQYEKVQNGIFGAHMKVDLLNDGPVTILIDSLKVF